MPLNPALIGNGEHGRWTATSGRRPSASAGQTRPEVAFHLSSTATIRVSGQLNPGFFSAAEIVVDTVLSMIATPFSREALLQAVNVLPAGPQILARLGTLL